MFPMCSPRVFPIAPRFNPVCFAQSPPLLTYIEGPKGEAFSHFSIESFAKVYGLKVRCYGGHVEEHIGTLRTILGS
jgi:hypothetical protein